MNKDEIGLGADHVGILLPSLSGGGAEFVAATWAAGLAKRGVKVTVLLTHAKSDESVPDGIDVVRIKSIGFLSRIRAVRAAVKGSGVDVLIALMPHWNVLALASTLGLDNVKVLISGRNTESVLVGSVAASFRAELVLARILYRRADGYIAISHPVAAEAIAKYRLDPARVCVVPNPATAKVNLHEAEALRKQREVRGDSARIVLTVPARIVEQKKPLIAIQVGNILRARGYDVEVHYFGDGPLRSMVDAEADRLNVPVTFHGWVTEWFMRCDVDAVVLLPSVAEGFGNVLVEAAAVGVPSVASSQALGLADAIVPGVTGELTPVGSSELLASAVERASRTRVSATPGWLDRFSQRNSVDILGVCIARAISRG